MFSSILLAVFVSFACGFKTGEIVNGKDAIFWYPHFQDECIEECRSNGTCVSLQGYMRYCSPKVGYTWSNKLCTGPCEPQTYDVSNSSTNPVPTGYYRCTTETTTPGQTWDYCSLHMYRSTYHQTIYGRRCKSSCQKMLASSKSVCSIGLSGSEMVYEECSENHEVTYKGEKCTSACRKIASYFRGDYYYCQTGFLRGDYCGPVLYLPSYQ